MCIASGYVCVEACAVADGVAHGSGDDGGGGRCADEVEARVYVCDAEFKVVNENV